MSEKLKDIDIELLDFPLNVRTRPGMYIGAVDNASKLLSEIIDNAVDEVYDGNNEIIYTKCIDGNYIVADKGRGIPVKTAIVTDKIGEGDDVKFVRKELNISQAELSISSLHSGSKFKKTSNLVGQNGVGSGCTNALSERYILLATLGNNQERVATMPACLQEDYNKIGSPKDYHFIEYHRGIFYKRGFCNLSDFKDLFGLDLNISFKPATLVCFKPDKDIFVSTKAYYPSNLKFVKKIAEVQGKKLEIVIDDKQFTDVLPSYPNNADSKILTKKADSINPDMRIVASFGVNETWNAKDRCASVNGLQTNEGIHVNYFEKAFHNAWSRHYFEAQWTELCSVNYWVICLANEPVFDSQTKVRLKNLPGIDMKDTYALEQQIIKEFKTNYKEWDLYAERIKQNLINVRDLGKIELIKTKVFIAAETNARSAAKFLPKKLKDCYGKNRQACQLWICEGESASGSIVKARNPEIHAVLPLRGRPMTTVYKDIEEVLENDEMRDLISCIGVGVKDYYNLDKVRYGKIVIATDAD